MTARRPNLPPRWCNPAIVAFSMLATFGLAASALLAQDQTAAAAQGERFDLKVRNDFFNGLAGNAEALARGMKACEETLAKNPKHGEALVWHGSGLLLMAGQEFQKGNTQKGLELWTKALKEMDDAVKFEPDNIGVRIPRGAGLFIASRFVPDPPTQKSLLERAVSDYERCYELQKNELPKLGVHPRGELLFGLAEGWRRLGKDEKARGYLEQIVKTCKDSAYEKEAKTWLATKPTTPEDSYHNCIGCHTE